MSVFVALPRSYGLKDNKREMNILSVFSFDTIYLTMLPGKWLLSGSGQASHGIKFVLLLFSLLL